MTASPPAGIAAQSESRAYFLIRVSHPLAGDPRTLPGMVERLGIGEKRSLQSGEERLRLLAVWPGMETKIRPNIQSGNC